MAAGRSMRSYHDDNGHRIFVLIGALVTIVFFTSLCEAQDEDYSSVSFMSSEGYLLPCVYRGIPHEHGEEWVINDCSTCVCTNATIECVIKGCPPHECEDAIHPPGTCCPMCPFHVNVSRVSPTAKILSTPKILPGRSNKLSLNVSMVFKENKRSTGVHGHNLWNMTIWASGNRQGEGFAYSVSKNVLTSDQRAQKYRKGKLFPKFKNIPFNLDATGLSCDDMRFICVRFDQADKPRHDNYEYVPFFFGGYPDDNSLTGCVTAPRCKKIKAKPTPPRPTTTAPTTTSKTTTVATTPTPAPTTTEAPTTRPTRRPKLRLTNRPNVESTSRPELTRPPAQQPFGDTFTMRSSFVTLMPLSYVDGWTQDSGSNEVVHQSPQAAQNQRGQRGKGGSSGSSGSQSIRRPGQRGSKRKTLSENALAAGLSSNEVEVLIQKRRQQIRRRHRQKQEQEQRMQQQQAESAEQYYQPYSGQQYRRQPQQQQYWRMQRQYEREQEEYERQRQQYMQQQENYQRQLQQYMQQQRQQQNQRYQQQQQQQHHQAQGYPYSRVRSGQLNPLYQRAIDAAVAEGTLHVQGGRVANNQRQSAHPVVGMPFDHAYMPPNSEEQ